MSRGGTGRRILVLLSGVAVVAALGCWACVRLLSELPSAWAGIGPAGDPPVWKPVVPQDPARRGAAAAIDAWILGSYYRANEAAADQAHKGKTLEVRGVVVTVGKDPLGGPCVTLDAGSGFGVQCFFAPAGEAGLARLTPGRVVTIRGTCSGKAGGVLLRDCELLE